MLQLRPSCECCDKDLPPGSHEARICSFECTFCSRCADGTLAGKCPNCGGELVARPRRPASKLAKFPASTELVGKQRGLPRGCVNFIFGVPATPSNCAVNSDAKSGHAFGIFMACRGAFRTSWSVAG